MNKKQNLQKEKGKYTNLDFIRQMTKGDSKMIMEMVNVYLEETPKYINKIKQGISTMDWESIARASHSFLPSFATMGMETHGDNFRFAGDKGAQLGRGCLIFGIVERSPFEAIWKLLETFKNQAVVVAIGFGVNENGTVTLIGAFGNSLTVAGDISYVPGVGLFMSVLGNNCSGGCIATVSATTGAAELLANTGPNDMWALAALDGELWAVGGSSDAYRVNQTTGVPSEQFSTSISGVADAAP